MGSCISTLVSNTNSLVGPLFFLADLAFLGAGAEVGAVTCLTAGLTTSSASGVDFLLFVFWPRFHAVRGLVQWLLFQRWQWLEQTAMKRAGSVQVAMA